MTLTATTSPVFDVCVIGSGAAGGMMTKQLCEAGAKVVLLEAGAEVKPHQSLGHKWPYELPYRGFHGEKQDLYCPSDVRLTIRYVDSERTISVDRIRVLGGRTLHWNAVVLRYAPVDFREATLGNGEEDWPISYDDLAPYYDRVERLIGVCGNNDRLPLLPAGDSYLPPLAPRCSEVLLKRGCESMGIPVIAVRKALLTRPYDRRPSCHYCGHCMDGCDVAAIFSTPASLLPKARATGNLTLRTNTIARQILVNDEGLARGVAVVNRLTRAEEEIRARIVVVCCATVETARLLLNSKSRQHPNGLANSSDMVGRCLHGHLGASTYMYLKELEGRAPANQDGATDHVYIPRFSAGGPQTTFGFQVNFNGFMYPFHAKATPGFGQEFKQTVRRMQPASLMLGGFGKVQARPENRVAVHSSEADTFGIPLPVVHFRFEERDLATHRAMIETVNRIAERLHATIAGELPYLPGGFASHEVGTARMGVDPARSVLNSLNQSHDVKNLFVTDGSSFTTSSEKNPTLTILALSMRAADYIVELRRRGDL